MDEKQRERPNGMLPIQIDDTVGAGHLALAGIRKMMLEGVLRPGNPIRQETVAERLGMSRVPVREALKMLEAEGLVTYRLNTGFALSPLSADELTQIYMMRTALERDLLLRLPQLSSTEIAELERLNRRMRGASRLEDAASVLVLNREFHFVMYALTNLPLIIKEVRRLWDSASRYNAVYAENKRSRDRSINEHSVMIETLKVGDNRALVELMDDHRKRAQSDLEARHFGAD